MSFSRLLNISCALGLALVVGSASAATNGASSRQTMVSPDFPLASDQLPSPTFPVARPGGTATQAFDQGNWHYELNYVYSQSQGWQVTKYDARRIHESQVTPVPESSLSPDCVIIHPQIASQPSPNCAGTNDGPPPDWFPPPTSPGMQSGQEQTEYYPQFPYNGGTYQVTVVWVWVVDANGQGHWEQEEFITVKNS